MIVKLDTYAPAALLDPEDFTAFAVMVPSDMDDEALRTAAAAVGHFEGEHLWVRSDWLASVGPGGSEWNGKLQNMFDYAARKGWTNAAGDVRAHIER